MPLALPAREAEMVSLSALFERQASPARKTAFPVMPEQNLENGTMEDKKDTDALYADVFITYANHSLKKNPKYFSAIWCRIERCFCMSKSVRVNIRKAIEIIEDFVGKLSREVDRDFGLMEEFICNEPEEHDIPLTLAYDTLIGSGLRQALGYCARCERKQEREAILGSHVLFGPESLKCHECDQLLFVHVLSEIVRGVEYSDIMGFKHITSGGSLPVLIKTDIRSSDDEHWFKEELIQRPVVRDEPIGSFTHFWNCLISYSLLAFLSGKHTVRVGDHEMVVPNRARLKRCKSAQCRKFFIEEHPNQKHCSPKCGKSRNRTLDTPQH